MEPVSPRQPLRVAIVGGGPSGFAAGEVLRDPSWNGAFEPVLFERQPHVGGKCLTVDEDGRPCDGTPGGYELGAGVLSHGSESNRHLEALLHRYGLSHTDAREPTRTKYRFYVDGRALTAPRVLGLALRHPVQALGLVASAWRYRRDLGRLSPTPSLDFTHRPADLFAPFSSTYSRAFNLLCSFGMQGFGYADLDDPALTPPCLYYHQYAPMDVIVNPVHTVDVGMQGIWATLARDWPPGSVRTGAEVLAVTRDDTGVTVTTAAGSERFDHLVVAVPLGPGLSFLDLDAAQRALIDQVRVNHYVSVLCRVSGLVDIAHVDLSAATDPSRLGDVVFVYKRYAHSDWCSINLYLRPGDTPDDATLVENAGASLQRQFGARLVEPERARVVHWRDYFPHLGPDALRAGWYERFEDLCQGRQRTLFVSSGLHMETVGASVKYATLHTRRMAETWINPRA